jgi:hypothetical protein
MRASPVATIDPELSVLGPVGFWIANTLGPERTFALGVGWPLVLGSVGLIATRWRLLHTDAVGWYLRPEVRSAISRAGFVQARRDDEGAAQLRRGGATKPCAKTAEEMRIERGGGGTSQKRTRRGRCRPRLAV